MDDRVKLVPDIMKRVIESARGTDGKELADVHVEIKNLLMKSDECLAFAWASVQAAAASDSTAEELWMSGVAFGVMMALQLPPAPYVRPPDIAEEDKDDEWKQLAHTVHGMRLDCEFGDGLTEEMASEGSGTFGTGVPISTMTKEQLRAELTQFDGGGDDFFDGEEAVPKPTMSWSEGD